jgi:transcriptional regulator with XRE-family HTH domain
VRNSGDDDMTSPSLKTEFGQRFRTARDGKKLSRAALAMRLGISPKTIQSWEMGRTFIEDLSLIPAIESELGVSFAHLLGQADESGAGLAAEPVAVYGTRTKAVRPSERAPTGPLRPVVNAVDAEKLDADEAEEAYVAAPLLRPSAAQTEPANLRTKDVQRYVLFPAEWCPRGRVVVAFRMSGASLAPAIPQGAHVIVDRRPIDPERLDGRFAALWVADRGLRIRQIEIDPQTGAIHGVPFGEKTRGSVELDFDKGDEILGRVLGHLAPNG